MLMFKSNIGNPPYECLFVTLSIETISRIGMDFDAVCLDFSVTYRRTTEIHEIESAPVSHVGAPHCVYDAARGFFLEK